MFIVLISRARTNGGDYTLLQPLDHFTEHMFSHNNIEDFTVIILLNYMDENTILTYTQSTLYYSK